MQYLGVSLSASANRQARLDSLPHKLRPPSIAGIGGVIAVPPQEHGLSGYFLPAWKVKVNECHAVFTPLPSESLVELHGLAADDVSLRAAGESGRHREVG